MVLHLALDFLRSWDAPQLGYSLHPFLDLTGTPATPWQTDYDILEGLGLDATQPDVKIG